MEIYSEYIGNWEKIPINETIPIWSDTTSPLKKLDDVLRYLSRKDMMDAPLPAITLSLYGIVIEYPAKEEKHKIILRDVLYFI